MHGPMKVKHGELFIFSAEALLMELELERKVEDV